MGDLNVLIFVKNGGQFIIMFQCGVTVFIIKEVQNNRYRKEIFDNRNITIIFIILTSIMKGCVSIILATSVLLPSFEAI